MCECEDNAELIMVFGYRKTYRCILCGKEWEEDYYNLERIDN